MIVLEKYTEQIQGPFINMQLSLEAKVKQWTWLLMGFKVILNYVS